MRANIRTKRDIVRRVEALVKLLESCSNNVKGEIESLTLDERQVTMNDLQSSRDLRQQVDAFIETLKNILLAAQEPRHEKWFQRLWFMQPDSDFLNDLGGKIDNARSDFGLVGEIRIRRHVEEAAKATREIYRVQREKDIQDILNGLETANASWQSALLDSKSLLHEGTRVAIRGDLVQWAVDDDFNKRVYILYGQAGMGKSSIAHAFCRELQQQSRIVVSFFFIREHSTCSDVYRVFPTIAYQLAEAIPHLRPVIADAARKHQPGHEKALDQQLKTLITKPLRTLENLAAPPGITFVFDGVDECANQSLLNTMLQLLCTAAREIPFLRILIATRPEANIMDSLNASKDFRIIHMRDLQKEAGANEDIRLFIRGELEKGALTKESKLLIERPDAVEILTKLAAGLFIWARVATSFLFQTKYLEVDNFDILVESQGANAGTEIQKLDNLYMIILQYSFPTFSKDSMQMHHVHQVLAWLVTTKFGFLQNEGISGDLLDAVGIPSSLTMHVIDRLRSVLVVEGEVTPTTPITVCHASFPQFLLDPSRCTNSALLVDPPSGNALIAKSTLDLLVRDDINIREAQRSIILMWQYSTGHWYRHVLLALYTDELGKSLRHFVDTHLSDWMRTSGKWSSDHTPIEAVDACTKVRDWCKKECPDDGLARALDNVVARRVQELAVEVGRSL
ncbi:hypothetical protein CERSUDRAFT_136944 [Gelatoporia subvermispora B]|uniref:Nephrocystin 3-like N-terminal domain-containing protein n=1 Tax=Ceriporiopsis subvermispora (strain B) TaxID=914234 RepID=M2QX38_CERS8|nr:hypothetical protein CERSUDRAFT_136944 [Gelatoporia subvermispora B]